MKIAALVVFLLFSFTTISYFFEIANAANDPILDIDGEELRAGEKYYVVSAIWGAGGGGLALGRAVDQMCPEIVVQRRSDLDRGTPVEFSNSDTNDDIIRLSTDINIEFVPTEYRICKTSTIWKLDTSNSDSTGKFWVTTDGVKGSNTLTSWFKIEKHGALGYKFRYCPSVDEIKTGRRGTLCSDIGKDADDGQIRLALAELAWPFVFLKASAATMIKQVVNV